jgi:hypothetical protein
MIFVYKNYTNYKNYKFLYTFSSKIINAKKQQQRGYRNCGVSGGGGGGTPN